MRGREVFNILINVQVLSLVLYLTRISIEVMLIIGKRVRLYFYLVFFN